MAADQEGGRIQRVTGPGFTTIPSALEQGQLPVTVLQADAAEWGRELAAAGVNLDLAPVMDVVPPGSDAAMLAIKAMLQRGYILLPEGEHGNVISFTPPLTITRAQLAKTVAELQKVLTTD